MKAKVGPAVRFQETMQRLRRRNDHVVAFVELRDLRGARNDMHAASVIEGRLKANCSEARYEVKGRPEDLAAARDLARRDKYQFQRWANWLLGVPNYRERKKGADRGIDGVIYFRNGPLGIGQILISVKGGENPSPDMISSLLGMVERENLQLDLFACVAGPTRRMR